MILYWWMLCYESIKGQVMEQCVCCDGKQEFLPLLTGELYVYEHGNERLSQLSCVSVGAEDSLALKHCLSSSRSSGLHMGHDRLQNLRHLCPQVGILHPVIKASKVDDEI